MRQIPGTLHGHMMGYIHSSEYTFKPPATITHHFSHNLKTITATCYSTKTFATFDDHSLLVLGPLFQSLLPEYPLPSSENYAEFIVKLYRDKGDFFYQHLDGQFLILLHDKRQNKIILCTNRYSATRLYYYTEKGILFWATSLSLLLNIVPKKPDFDIQSIPSFLQTGFSSTEHSQFKNIKRLLPTASLIITDHFPDAYTPQLNHHWNTEFSFQRQEFNDLEAQLDEYEACFSKSIATFLSAVQPSSLGCLLSGGHDTTFNFIHASKLFHKPIHTFTGYFEHYGFDERPKAAYVTKQFNGIHHHVPIGNEILDWLPTMVSLSEEPTPGGALPIFACIKEASQHVDCLLSGDAGDTLWDEYYPVAEWHRYLTYMPHFLRAALHRIVKASAHVFDWERLWEAEHVFSLFAPRNMYDNFFNRLCTYRHFSENWLSNLLDANVFDSTQSHDCAIQLQFNNNNFNNMLIEAKMLYGVYQYMIPVTQKPLEACGTHFYTPYFNPALMSFINSLPVQWLNSGSSLQKLINDAHKRRFHKYALMRYLPKRFVYSVQQSFDVPFHSFLNERPEILTNLYKRLSRRGWFNNNTLKQLFDEFPKQKVKPHELIELKHHGYRLFCLLALETWYSSFVEQQPSFGAASLTSIPLDEFLL